ncbi:hypothetical protein [Liquorilactobacillus mali]|uniref:Uncharacterized protein n=1 Tax=Liquorilactobacillus mali KCTC 3596 = DSM 20444 TaxID=1046596 RepID=J1F3Z1_9LACO|nr:hypothetical protein [Liquorilactobacillus mali]EJF00324.1 hypothetical protein LMA_03728 [Liquorilactobacillus mali KCTC 3596 = DSM 20444]KRN04939.1 hypothetical protein FD00_GL000375 [Liquorilactobacillus mali KCTC 3596 = DSM 20444]MDC7954191.1 hypothetical protein [Liquorilactobacillus mali]QFQ75715.1 hypothetical protein LM596_11760 [Liquorilactobacillus mali]
MINIKNVRKILYLGAVTLASVIAFPVFYPVDKISADTNDTTTQTLTRANTTPSLHIVSFMQEPVSGGSSKGKWEYMYTYGPYAFFKNTATGNWKTVQIISTTKYTISVIVNGYEQTFKRYLKGEYAAG